MIFDALYCFIRAYPKNSPPEVRSSCAALEGLPGAGHAPRLPSPPHCTCSPPGHLPHSALLHSAGHGAPVHQRHCTHAKATGECAAVVEKLVVPLLWMKMRGVCVCGLNGMLQDSSCLKSPCWLCLSLCPEGCSCFFLCCCRSSSPILPCTSTKQGHFHYPWVLKWSVWPLTCGVPVNRKHSALPLLVLLPLSFVFSPLLLILRLYRILWTESLSLCPRPWRKLETFYSWCTVVVSSIPVMGQGAPSSCTTWMRVARVLWLDLPPSVRIREHTHSVGAVLSSLYVWRREAALTSTVCALCWVMEFCGELNNNPFRLMCPQTRENGGW